MISRVKTLALTASLLLPLAAGAHHGLDYFVLQDGTAPALWKLTTFTAADLSRMDGIDEYNLETGMLLGLGRDIGLGVGFGFIDEDSADWRYSSVTPYLSLPLFRSDDLPWLKVSLYAGYQLAADAPQEYQTVVSYELPDGTPVSAPVETAGVSSKSTRSGGSSVTSAGSKKSVPRQPASASTPRLARHGGGAVGGGGPDAPGGGGHDHPVAAPAAAPRQTREAAPVEPMRMERKVPIDHHRGATGIHRHGENGMVARLIASVQLSDNDQMVMNFINFTPETGNVGWGYAVGYRHAFHHDLAMSLEAIGDFDSTVNHEVVLGVHYSPIHRVVVRVGVGTGIGTDSTQLALHTGLVIRF
jgi:hypothetical protein